MKQLIASLRIHFPGLIIFTLILCFQGCEKPGRIVSVQTNEVKDIGTVSCNVLGTIIDVGDEGLDQHGFCYSLNESPTIDDMTKKLGSISSPGGFTSELSGLVEDTKYYVRAFAQNSSGEYYGDELTFTTLAFGTPQVITKAISNITDTTANCDGEVRGDMGIEVGERGFCWSTSSGPTTTDFRMTTGSGIGIYSNVITDLVPGTMYYVRAYAEYNQNIVYGNEESFQTTEVDVALTATTVYEKLDEAYEDLKWARGEDEYGAYKGYADLIIMLNDLSSDNAEFTTSDGNWGEIANLACTPQNEVTTQIWDASYHIILKTNLLVEAADYINELTSAQKESIKGQARTLRAYCYLNLVQIFGGVPLVVSSDVSELSTKSRASVNEVLGLIIADLDEAEIYLMNDPDNDETKINKWTAVTLKARAQLLNKDWANAMVSAEKVMNSGIYNLSSDYSQIFNGDVSSETIWRLDYQPGTNNIEYYDGLPGEYFYASQNLRDAFIESDNRYELMFTDSLIRKIGEDIHILRYAEILMIAGECSHNLGDDAASVSYINQLVTRVDLPALSSWDVDLPTIIRERRFEFVMEGMRWFDIIRMDEGDLDDLLDNWGISLDQYKLLFPIPQSALDDNSNLVQNPGY